MCKNIKTRIKDNFVKLKCYKIGSYSSTGQARSKKQSSVFAIVNTK